MAEWSKALASGASPQGRGFEPHSCHSACRLQAPELGWGLSAGAIGHRGPRPAAPDIQRRHRSALPGAGPVQRLRSSLLPELTRTSQALTVWPSGLRRWLKAPVRKGVGSNPTAVTFSVAVSYRHTPRAATCSWETPRPPPSWETPSAIWASQSCAGACRQGTDPLCLLPNNQDSLAEWSKALASGASPQGRGLEPHSCQFWWRCSGAIVDAS